MTGTSAVHGPAKTSTEDSFPCPEELRQFRQGFRHVLPLPKVEWEPRVARNRKSKHRQKQRKEIVRLANHYISSINMLHDEDAQPTCTLERNGMPRTRDDPVCHSITAYIVNRARRLAAARRSYGKPDAHLKLSSKVDRTDEPYSVCSSKAPTQVPLIAAAVDEPDQDSPIV